jgi:quercetin dioxygenase-like cupin family protein
MLIVRGDAQTLPSELNKAATGEVWFDPILPTTDGVDVGTIVFSPHGRTVWYQHQHEQLLQITSGYGFVCKGGEAPQRVRRHGMDRAQRVTVARRHPSHADVAHHHHDRCD